MPRRFSDIYRGGELKLALDNLNTYRADAATRQSPRITGKGEPKNRQKVIVAVAPFYMAATSDAKLKVVQVGASKASYDATAADNFGKTETDKYLKAASDSNTEKPDGFSPARIRTFNPTSEKGSYEKSKFTGLYYVKRPGVGYSLPFGKKLATDSYESVLADLRSSLATEVNAEAYRRVNFTEEFIPG